ncbi:hypothetical protein F2Q70_00016010 [Brassica cretica]|uniref:Uncharacterized protein n=1 Tax=Brassica cretica TaxID=69181 RepID=A0A8S9I2E8_BRACR|nr:hypothetical protein F2Q70_00016010 [Brassica cretica]KAF2596485.1 hypothetical protein F2Q68_00008936 [Brassica cretica]
MNWSRSWSKFCDFDRIVPSLSHSASGPWCMVGRPVMFLFDCWLAGRFGSVTKVCSTRCLAGWTFDSSLNAHEWNRKAKEEINLQKDVKVSVQALEQLGSQLRTLDESDENSEWQWDCHIPFIRVEAYACFKKNMKGLQSWLKMELREVRRDKRKQEDAEDKQAYSRIRRCRHKGRIMDLDQTGQVLIQRRRYHDRDLQAQSVAKAKSLGGRILKHPCSASMASLGEIEESNDLVNHIGDVFRYFIVDVMDLGSTPDVARCGREFGENFLSHEQG